MKDKETPLRMIRKWSKADKSIYEFMDFIHETAVTCGFDWPTYCILPFNIPAALMAPEAEADMSFDECYSARKELREIETCWLWRKYKPIYHFDADLSELLIEQAEKVDRSERLPSELLLHPPYPAIYIKAPCIAHGKDGFFYWVDYDMDDKWPMLRIIWVNEDMTTSEHSMLPLLPGATIDECVDELFRIGRDNYYHSCNPDAAGDIASFFTEMYLYAVSADMGDEVIKALQFILYIIADNAEINEDPVKSSVKEKSCKSNQGRARAKVSDSVSSVKSYSVGIRTGAAIRKYKKRNWANVRVEGTGSRKCPHTRKAHWHHYWTGPRDGERKLILRWLAPMYVNMDTSDPNSNSATVYPVHA